MISKKNYFYNKYKSRLCKIKNVINEISKLTKFELYIFITGMHMERKFGSTWEEVTKVFKNIKIKNFQIKLQSKDWILLFQIQLKVFLIIPEKSNQT